MNQPAQKKGVVDFIVSLIPSWVSPNHLTILRIICSLLMVVIELYRGSLGVIIILGLVAGLSDLLDGAVARRRGQETALGAFLDPFSDKIYAVVLVFLVIRHQLVPIWLLLCLLVTEVHTVLMPILVILRRRRRQQDIWPPPKVEPNRWGKLKTGWIAGALGFSVIAYWAGLPHVVTFCLANLFVGLAMGLAAEYIYLRDFLRGSYQ